jgi:hypothetical protein
MKKFEKLIVIVLSLFLIVGCGCTNKKASDAVKDYLDNYRNLDDSVTTQLDDVVATEDLTDDQKETYKEILERQYKNMTYEITDEVYDGDEATVTALITVYDYYKVQQEVAEYLKDNREEFYKDGVYDEDSYIDYKLDTMKKYDETITYTIDFKVTKENNKWVVNDLSDTDVEKIHGIYDYTND